MHEINKFSIHKYVLERKANSSAACHFQMNGVQKNRSTYRKLTAAYSAFIQSIYCEVTFQNRFEC